MFGRRTAILAGLLAAWAAFALWQFQRFRYERRLIDESMHQSAHSVMTALLSGIRSHRRLGRFFEQQMEGMLEELVLSGDVLAVALLSGSGERFLQAGAVDLLDAGGPTEPGDYWEPAGFRMVERFDIEPTVEGPGRGPGFGMGRGAGWRQQELGTDFNGGTFQAVLVLDTRRHEQLVRRAAWTACFISLAGGLVLISLTGAWGASVRLVAARGQARLLETETRHWRELSQAAAGLAHETRNPLGLIRGWTQRLAAGQTDPADRQQHARAVIEECDRVTARINQFLAFARPWQPQPAGIPICGVIAELSAILEPDLQDKGLQLDCQADGRYRVLRADRELLRQALFNMVQNAIQFAPEGDAITIRIAGGRAGHVRIEVADRGPGVAPAAAPSLFSPYFTTRSDGTGLGLAIVRRIALAHGWTAGYTPRPGGGALFWLDDIPWQQNDRPS